MKFTACPLDCYDACEIVYENNILKPSKDFLTAGKLCLSFGRMQNEKKLFDKNIDVTLGKLAEKLKVPNQKNLYYKGSGNMGVMQNIPKVFFEKIGATFATGSNCEAAGESGIEMGRGYSVNPDISDLISSDVIIVWGRNFSITSRHIYKLIQDKSFIVIDPVEIPIAKNAYCHLQIVPKGDFILAGELLNYLDGLSVDFDKLDSINIKKEDFIKVSKILTTKKISVMLGIGAQKYKEGAQIFHQMDKLFHKLGLLIEGNKGVWYLANSKYRFDDKINIKTSKHCGYADVKFDDYDIVFIQGANPVVSAMDTARLKKELENTFVVVMGTRNDETAQIADIVIPAKNFLQKKDIRLSYSHDEVRICEVCEENNYAVSEYELTKYLFEAFGFTDLLSEDEYLEPFRNIVREKPNKIDFKNHCFAEIKPLESKKDLFYFLSSKKLGNINSQFGFDKHVYINSCHGYKDGEMILIESSVGNIQLPVKNDNNILKNCVLVYSGNKEVNKIIPTIVSDYGNNGSYQDFLVELKG